MGIYLCLSSRLGGKSTVIQAAVALGLLCGTANADEAAPAGLQLRTAGLSASPSYSADNRQIYTITVNGTQICEKSRVDCDMIIGSCSGADTPGNVRSTDSDGSTLLAPGSCPGSPFSFRVSGTNPIHVSASVGPLAADYATLSVPLCMIPEYFTNFNLGDAAQHSEGCGNTWRTVAGSSGELRSIYSPCALNYDGKYLGQVGQARYPNPAAGAWAELSGATATVRATVTGGGAHYMSITNHPYTFCIEPSWERLKRGQTVTLEQDILVTGQGGDDGDDDGGGCSACNVRLGY
jgi:hypothetical protein